MSDQNGEDDVPIVLDLVKASIGWQKSTRVSQNIDQIVFRGDCQDGNKESSKDGGTQQQASLSSSAVDNTDQLCCGVCKQHYSRYKCPRCSIPYCSLECYKNHNNAIDNDGDAATSCTETFYKDRVSSILRLEQKEQKDAFFKNQILKNSLVANNLNVIDDSSGVKDDKITEQLYDLLEVLESSSSDNNNAVIQQDRGDHDEEDDALLLQKIKQSMSPTLRMMFENDITNNGQTLLEELGIIKQWHPWWRPELSSPFSPSSSGEESKVEQQQCVFEIPSQTLDERLLQVADWTKIRRPIVNEAKKTNTSDNITIQQLPLPPIPKQPQHPHLIYNTIDILYGICKTLRLYHGIDNVLNTMTTTPTNSGSEDVEDTPPSVLPTTSSVKRWDNSNTSMALDASETLLKSSAVLGKDARYTTLEQCLMGSTACSNTPTTTGASPSSLSCTSNDDTTAKEEWKILVEDCSLLCQSRRMIGRALLEGRDIIQAAIQQLKLKKKKQQEDCKNGDKDKLNKHKQHPSQRHEQYISQLRKLKKKIDFYLSYSQSSSSLPETDLEAAKIALVDWMDHWASMVEE